MNNNTEYELFTQEVYQLLATYTGLVSSSVRHNVKLKGKSGQEHQVDVYWEYHKDGEVHRVAIECKNYNQKISIGRVRDFFGVLYDVGNIKGIMACKEGYQDGAKKFADYYGISLMELRVPKDEETMIGELDIKWEINGTHQLFLVDEEWAAKHEFDMALYRERLDFLRIKRDNKWRKSSHLPFDTSDNLIRDEKGNVLTSIDDLKKREPDKRPNDNTIIYCLKDSYVHNKYWGLVKINEVMFEDEHTVEENTYSIDAGHFVRAILEDALGGEKMVIL
ncbi:MAG: restriction endonuclease [Bacteroidaceae bacterium]|nr:restriction endonuclease [Bacteroidaceae bacterium]